MSNLGNQQLGDIILGAFSEEEGSFVGGHGQAQGTIRTTYYQHGQAQARIKQTYFGLGQAQALIGNKYSAHGQAQALIYRAQGYGQSNASIKQTYPLCTGEEGSGEGGAILGSMILGESMLGSSSSGGEGQVCIGPFGQAQALIQTDKFAHGQAQAAIKQVYYGHGQSQAEIKQTYYAHGQAQALLGTLNFVHGQAQGSIKTTYYQHGQSQANIKQIYNAHGQAQALIKNTYYVHGQAQAFITSGFSVYLQDTFTRTTAYGTVGSPDIGPSYSISTSIDDDHIRINGSELELHVGDAEYSYVNLFSLINKNNIDYFIEFKIETYDTTPYSFFVITAVDTDAQVYMSNFDEWTLETPTGSTIVPFITDENIWYVIRLQAEGANARFKIWPKNEAEPTTWSAQRTGVSGTGYISLYADEGDNDPARLLIDNIYVRDYYPETMQRMSGQAQALIIDTRRFGQATAQVDSPIKQAWGQAQALIIGQNALLKDTFSRIIYLTDDPKSQLGIPDSGWYSYYVTAERGMISRGTRLEAIPYQYSALSKEAYFGAIVNATNFTAQYDFFSGDYVAANYFIEIFARKELGGPFVDFYVENSLLTLESQTDVDSQAFTLVDGTAYRMMLFVDSTSIRAKIWDISTPEPDWMLEIPGFVLTFVEIEFSTDLGSLPAGTEFWIDNLGIYSTDSAIGQSYGQARAVIITNVKQAYGQARPRIKKEGNNRHGQAQARIRLPAGFGQAQALISKAVFKSGQAQAQIATPGNAVGQAQAQITTTTPNGQSQAYIYIIQRNHAQAQGYIELKRRVFGQAQATIEVLYITYGQAQAMIDSAIKVKSGHAQAIIYYRRTSSGQAQAKINNILFIGQAQAQIKQAGRGSGQSRAVILRPRAFGQAQARIQVPFMGYGQAQALINGVPMSSGQAQAKIAFYNQRAIGIAQAYILKPRAVGQAQARILSFEQKVYGQAQAFVRRTDTRRASGQAKAQIRRSDPTGQAQALIAGGRYLVQFNGYHLPGYAQVEDYQSTAGIFKSEVTYQNEPFSEYIGLENKIISLRMRVAGQTYLDVKNQVQQAGTMVRSSRDWEKLYIQKYDRHYLALTGKITTEKTVGESMRLLDYTVEWEALPWLISDIVNVISGTGTVSTVGRNLGNGGWTPAKVIISGTDVTISGYNQYGEFTGFISVSGTVVDMVINSEEYTSTINGINSNDKMYNPDYMLFVGPGQTFFEVTGATDCVIEYQDRWYL